MSGYDSRFMEVGRKFRRARNEYLELLQEMSDGAELKRINAGAIDQKVAVGYGEVNEGFPVPGETNPTNSGKK